MKIILGVMLLSMPTLIVLGEMLAARGYGAISTSAICSVASLAMGIGCFLLADEASYK